MRLSRNRESRMIQGKEEGFALIELMMVAAIAAILGMIAYPSYQHAIRKSRRVEGRSALLQLMQQQERYYSKNNSYIVFSAASTDQEEKKFAWFSGDVPAKSSYEINAAPCKEETIQQCVLLTAKPGTDKVNKNFKDEACGDLMLTSTGLKTASGEAADCWS